MEINDEDILAITDIHVDLALINATYVLVYIELRLIHKIKVRDATKGYDLVSQILKVQEELHET